MGHQIQYLVRTGGKTFNAILDPQKRATASDLELFNREGAKWGGRLPDSQLGFAADLSSEVATLITLPIKYSWLVPPSPDHQTAEIVEAWESRLQTLLPGVLIMRLDEILLEHWSVNHDADWLKHDVEVNEFLTSIQREDNKHWKQVS